MTKEEKINTFAILLNEFETDKFRDYCSDMIEFIPDYLFTIPASTTGKYHNEQQCGERGQILHIVMFGKILNYILSLKYNKTVKFPEAEQRDMMRCVPIFHDAIKCGWDGGQYTVFEHPLLAGELVRTTEVEHDISVEEKEKIARMCEAHSGEWTTSKRSSSVLPEPMTEAEMLIHECDILSSRVDLILDMTKVEIPNIPKEEPNPMDYIMPFGKFKGIKLNNLTNETEYFEWLINNTKLSSPLKEYAQLIVDGQFNQNNENDIDEIDDDTDDDLLPFK